ncbi:glycosyltransferase [bacterium]|nr:glycosyltransferase [bacterium]
MSFAVKNQVNPELSIIVAVYNEDPRNLLKLIDRLELVLRPEMVNYELIFVNDGSREPTTNALRHIAVESRYIKLVELSRNFGQQAAITAGLDHAEGLAMVNMDSDLQDPPELIPAMLEKWKGGYDVVYATRSKRRDRFSKRLTAFLFYRFLGAISSVQIPWDTGDFRLMDRVVVDALKSMPEKTRFIRGMIPWLGFKQCGVPLDRDAREIGESAYTVKKLLCLALDGILSFSAAPLFFISGFGLTVTLASFAALILSLAMNGFNLDNFALLSGMGIFTGMQIMIMGIVSVYLSKILDETRARPTYVVAHRVGGGFAQSEYDIESGAGETALIQNRSNSVRNVL